MANAQPAKHVSLQKLMAFLTSQEYQVLAEMIKSRPPNVFQITGISTKEVYLSRVVAWLLDPEESHGLGQGPLHAFLTLVVDAMEDEESSKLKPALAEAIAGGVSGVHMTTEHVTEQGRPDIVLKFDKPSLLLVIENKIHAGYRKSKLEKYRDWAKSEAGRKEHLLVLLTLFGTDPGLEYIQAVAYKDWIPLLKRMRSGSGPSQFILDQYLTNMEGIMGTGEQNEQLEKLRRRIWSKHPATMRFLSEWSPGKPQFIEDVAERLELRESFSKFEVEPKPGSGWLGLHLHYCKDVYYAFSLNYLDKNDGPGTWVIGLSSPDVTPEHRDARRAQLSEFEDWGKDQELIEWTGRGDSFNMYKNTGWLCYLNEQALQDSLRTVRKKIEEIHAESKTEETPIYTRVPQAKEWELGLRTVVTAVHKLHEIFPPQELATCFG